MTEKMVVQGDLPEALFRAEQVRELDRIAIEDHGILGLTLMERAGTAAYRLSRSMWPDAVDITVVCGTGNNGGDGFVVARLALADGLKVRVLQLGDSSRLRGDAKTNADAFLDGGGEVLPWREIPAQTDVIVDGLFGTGLEREVSGNWSAAIAAMNSHPAPIIALDIPSGLHSDTGKVLGIAVKAVATISFIGLKQGIYTGDGPEQCGVIHFNDLDVPNSIYAGQKASALRLDWTALSNNVQPRSRIAHKGQLGHVLVIGGAPGFSGAARMAAEAAARTGAGLVSVATSPQHAAFLNIGRPEIMCKGVSNPLELSPLLGRATVIAVGPGIGTSEWGLGLFGRVLETTLPLVVDADALNLLAADPVQRDNWILTPHPGEAARLLGCSSSEIQADRFSSVRRLQQRYGGVVVLKGAGTLVACDGDSPVSVCTDGNPGMASGGMGDVLTGIIAALLAQGHSAGQAAVLGASLHGAAADRAARNGERGLLAGDLMDEIRLLINPDVTLC